jgi:hypothetical protein
VSQIPPEVRSHPLPAVQGTEVPGDTTTEVCGRDDCGVQQEPSSPVHYARKLADACLRASPTTQSLMECLDWHVLAFGRCALALFQAETPLPMIIRAILALSALSAISYGACRLWLP